MVPGAAGIGPGARLTPAGAGPARTEDAWNRIESR